MPQAGCSQTWVALRPSGVAAVKEVDRALVEAIRRQDVGAFDELYATYFSRILSLAIRRLSDVAEAEDATQEVFTAVFTCIDRFQGRSDLVVWIYGITRNLVNNRLRRRASMRMISLEEVPADRTPVDLTLQGSTEARQALGHLETAIAELPREQRRILEMRHTRQLAIKKIAELLDRSEDAVKSSLYRARRTLAAKLPEDSLTVGH